MILKETKKLLMTQFSKGEILITKISSKDNTIDYKLPYSSTKFETTITASDIEGQVSEFVDDVNNILEDMANHLSDCMISVDSIMNSAS